MIRRVMIQLASMNQGAIQVYVDEGEEKRLRDVLDLVAQPLCRRESFQRVVGEDRSLVADGGVVIPNLFKVTDFQGMEAYFHVESVVLVNFLELVTTTEARSRMANPNALYTRP